MAAVTREVTEVIISAKKIPPLQTNEPLNQTDTKADKANDDEHENKRVVGDSTNKFANPSDRASDKRANVIDDSGERTGGRSTRR